ncbi:MAG: hypothetical protein ACFFC0_02335, partial [Promethearchaeota archaeon]
MELKKHVDAHQFLTWPRRLVETIKSIARGDCQQVPALRGPTNTSIRRINALSKEKEHLNLVV